ncbi:serine protease FAM111A-like [Garra rufa]|uniref:serine protease FAM111A-like n=1 Tax=Garra rufa TaxID=137080 RepID=UPI003CCED08D
MDNWCKKEDEERPSIVLKQEKMDDSLEKASSSKYDPQQSAKGESHYFSFCYKSKNHGVECDSSKTVLDALKTNKTFIKIEEENKEKEIVIQRSKGAAVNIDFPCCLIEKDEVLDISFIKNGKQVSSKKKTTGRHSFSGQSENLVTFNIKTTGGEKVKCLMKNNKLRMEVDDVCVYAFKKEKFKAALRRDGRFSSVIFEKQCELYNLQSKTNYRMSHTVEHHNGKHFKIIVTSDKKEPDSQEDLSDECTEMNEASAADLKEDPNQHPINTEQEETQKRNTMKSTTTSTHSYELIPDSEEILKILRNQYKGLVNKLKEREELKDNSKVQKFLRAEYDKSVQSFSEVYKIKQLMGLSVSVCQIQVERFPRGTGFLLFGRFVLTNAHVITKYLESSDKLSLTTHLEAAFDFEHPCSNVNHVPVKKQIAAYSFITDGNKCRLDFALLELDDVQEDDEITGRPDLLQFYKPGPLPNSGGICIVGHPEGGIKRMDPCFLIGKENLEKAEDKHKSENSDFIHVMTHQSFVDQWDIYKNQITYDSCFFHGSSGSPVFDEDCCLIGVHTGGYEYPIGKSKRSIMEYAFSMQPILESIITQAKKMERSDILNLLSEYKSLNLGDNDVDMEENS